MSGEKPAYNERLTVPRWWWPMAVGVAALLGAEIHAGYGGLRAVLPYVGVGLLALGGLAALGRGRVRVAGGELLVLDARLPLGVVGDVRVLDRLQTRRVVGRYADPTAFHVTRSWIPGSVWIEVVDPADDTPYWVVSSRHPERLAGTLRQARTSL